MLYAEFFDLSREVPGAVFICTVFITFGNELNYFYEDETRDSVLVQNQGHILQQQCFGHLTDGVCKLCSFLSGLKSNASLFHWVCQLLLNISEDYSWKNLAPF